MDTAKIRISLIIPFYGVDGYIGKCLSTIYEQDLSEEEYEVICINDCSPDNSEEIVLEYAAKHSNLKLLKHDVNLKLGAARNTGLRAAKGRYVWFIDSDDYIKSNCLREILSYCEKNNLEIFHFGIQNNKGHIVRHLIDTDVITGPEEEIISKNQQSIEITFPWNRVYERRFLLDNNLWFNDLYGGDVIHTIEAVNLCKRIKNVDRFYYFYRIDNSSSDTHSVQTAEKIYNMCYVLAREIKSIEPKMNDSWRHLVEECAPWRVNSSLKSILRLSNEEQQKLFDLLNANRELKKFVFSMGKTKLKLLLQFPLLTQVISYSYNLLRKIK